MSSSKDLCLLKRFLIASCPVYVLIKPSAPMRTDFGKALMIFLNALLSFPVREPTSPKMDTKGFVAKSISQALIYAVLYPDFSRYFSHILTNVVFPVPYDPFNAIVNPPSAQSITEVRILANGSLSSLQFAKGLSAGISGNEGLSFIVSSI